MIGNERKEKRLHYLKNYWFDKVKNVPKVKLHTSLSPKWGCAIGNVSIEGKKPEELDSFLLDKYKVIQSALTGKTYTVFVSLQMFIQQQRI
jgi:selenocysteine lyase/cysteine desulfurase